tara:strand:+ start:21125 stop:22015 length:891 start_codon:yes stop_codon:yes gene_type:complete
MTTLRDNTSKSGTASFAEDWRSTPFFPLFVPANRPERFEKAVRAGCGAIIADLEDAVADDEKQTAREMLVRALQSTLFPIPVIVRINGIESDHFEQDIQALADLPVATVMLPKAEDGPHLETLRQQLKSDTGLIGLVETPKGIAEARVLALQCDRLAFGSIDFASSIRAEHTRDALHAARSELVLASALAGIPQPLDGVTVEVDAADTIEDDARYSASLGFGGKLLIHPAQVVPGRSGFAPAREAVEKARQMLASTGGNAGRFEGRMVDKPVILQAQRMIQIFERIEAQNAELAGD